MIRLALFVLAAGLLAIGLSWIADEPGALSIEWLGYQVETSVFAAAIMVGIFIVGALLVWSLLRFLVTRPAAVREMVRRKRERKGLDALSLGLIAVGSGDKEQARKLSAQAYKLMPQEPLTGLLRAQTAQLHGDRAAAREIFQAMAEKPDTEMLGLRGLFLEAKREQHTEAARLFAERAMERNPDLAWSVNALFELQCRASDWEGALRTLDIALRHKQIEKPIAERRRAVLLTAQAQDAEEADVNRARQLALEAHKLAPGLVPAVEIAGRIMASQGDATRAAKVIAKTWELSPHPDLAFTYAHLRPGDGPRDRLKRVRHLAQWSPDPREAAIAVATAALDAREWGEARAALEPYVESRPQARICTLMARVEGGETGDQGRVREWLARAVRAPRDPAWTADGYISDQWSPVSPITGELDAFEWKAPVELIAATEPLIIEDTNRPAASVTQVSEQPATPEPDTVAPPPKDTDGGRGADGGEDVELFTPPHLPDDPGPEPDDVDSGEPEEQKTPVPSA